MTFDHLDPSRLPEPTDADLTRVKTAAAARRRRQVLGLTGGGALAMILAVALLVVSLGGNSRQADRVTSSGGDQRTASTSEAPPTTVTNAPPTTAGGSSGGRRSSGGRSSAAGPGGGAQRQGDVLFARNGDLWIMNADGSNQTLLEGAHTSSRYGRVPVSGAGWSADRARIAVGAGQKYTGELYTLSAGGGDVRVLRSDYSTTGPAYSPDNRLLAYIDHPGISATGSDLSRGLYVVNTDGAGAHEVAGGDGRLELAPSAPTWTRDGRRLVFAARDDSESPTTTLGAQPFLPYRLYSVARDGGDLRQLSFPDEARDPTLSLDDTKLAFVNLHGTAAPGLYIADRDGSNARLVVPGDDLGQPTWSPDNTRLMFVSSRGASPVCQGCVRPTSIYVVNADGSNLRRVTSPPESQSDYAPAWA